MRRDVNRADMFRELAERPCLTREGSQNATWSVAPGPQFARRCVLEIQETSSFSNRQQQRDAPYHNTQPIRSAARAPQRHEALLAFAAQRQFAQIARLLA